MHLTLSAWIRPHVAAAATLLLTPVVSTAGGIPTTVDWLEEVVVTGRLDQLHGAPLSATVGVVTSEQLDWALRVTLTGSF